MAERPCRCLLADSAPDMAALVADYVDSLQPEERAEETLRSRRLAQCLSCCWLRSGTCALCGCYVEARSARRAQRCPDTPPRWQAVLDTQTGRNGEE